jgi:hypothetical protein
MDMKCLYQRPGGAWLVYGYLHMPSPCGPSIGLYIRKFLDRQKVEGASMEGLSMGGAQPDGKDRQKMKGQNKSVL